MYFFPKISNLHQHRWRQLHFFGVSSYCVAVLQILSITLSVEFSRLFIEIHSQSRPQAMLWQHSRFAHPVQFRFDSSCSADWLPLRVPVQHRVMNPSSYEEFQLSGDVEFLQSQLKTADHPVDEFFEKQFGQRVCDSKSLPERIKIYRKWNDRANTANSAKMGQARTRHRLPASSSFRLQLAAAALWCRLAANWASSSFRCHLAAEKAFPTAGEPAVSADVAWRLSRVRGRVRVHSAAPPLTALSAASRSHSSQAEYYKYAGVFG